MDAEAPAAPSLDDWRQDVRVDREAAFRSAASLLRDHADRSCCRIGIPRSETADIVQESLLRLLTMGLPENAADIPFAASAAGIVRNIIRESVRDRRTRRRALIELAHIRVREPRSPEPNPEARLSDREIAWQHLTPNQCAALEEHLRGASGRVAARSIRISRSAYRARLAGAVARLTLAAAGTGDQQSVRVLRAIAKARLDGRTLDVRLLTLRSQGTSYSEIAVRLGCSEGAARKRASRALARAR